MYFVNKDININDIKIKKEELSEVRWFSINEQQNMFNNKELNNDQIECFMKVCKYIEKKH